MLEHDDQSGSGLDASGDIAERASETKVQRLKNLHDSALAAISNVHRHDWNTELNTRLIDISILFRLWNAEVGSDISSLRLLQKDHPQEADAAGIIFEIVRSTSREIIDNFDDKVTVPSLVDDLADAIEDLGDLSKAISVLKSIETPAGLASQMRNLLLIKRNISDRTLNRPEDSGSASKLPEKPGKDTQAVDGRYLNWLVPQTLRDKSAIIKVEQGDPAGEGQSSNELDGSFANGSPLTAASLARGTRRIGEYPIWDREGKKPHWHRRQFACPFFLHNVHDHPCQGFNRIGDIRQHLFRKHMQQKHCPVCGIVFTDNRSSNRLEAHIREGRCTKVDFHHPGITTDQWQAICQRAQDLHLVDVERWFFIWRIIFPRELEPSSPYIDSSVLAMRVHDIRTQFFSKGLASQVVDEIYGDVTADLKQAALENFHLFMNRFQEFTHSYDNLAQEQTGSDDTRGRVAWPNLRSATRDSSVSTAAESWDDYPSTPIDVVTDSGTKVLHFQQGIPRPPLGVHLLSAPIEVDEYWAPHVGEEYDTKY